MATIKAFSDLKQSRKLAEILPLESADMEYLTIKEDGLLISNVPFVKDDSEVEDSAYSHTYNRIACWSLAALLNVIPKHIKDYLIDDFVGKAWDWIEDNILSSNQQRKSGLYCEQFRNYMKGE